MNEDVQVNKKLNLKESIRNLKLTWKFVKRNKKYLILYTLFSFLLTAIGVFTPMLSAKQLLFINGSEFDKVINISIFIFIVEITRNVCRFFSRKTSQLFFSKTLTDIQIELSRETLKLETEEIDNNSSGVFIDRLNRDSESIADIFGLLTDAIADVIANIGVLGAIFIVNKAVFIYFIVALIVLYVINKLRIKQRFKRDKEFRKLREKNTGLIGEMIRGLKDVKVLGSEENFLKVIKKRLIESNQKRYEMSDVDRKYILLNGNVQDIFTLGFIVLCIYLVIIENLTLENFVVLYMYQERVYNLLNFTSSVLEYMKNFNLSASRVFEIIDNEKFKKESFGTITKEKINGDFEFKNVTFGYGEKKNIIKDLSFKINANETVAFVGRSGAGKTTIFNLLTKLYHPKKGNIYIDGVNINNLTKDSIRNNISIITQNPYIFNFTIKENLKFVKEDATDNEIIDACKKASLHDFIMTLPDKYDTLVGEGGVTLSGGQRQRLAIARAFIKDSEIMLFDEATSALDNETQSDIQDAINKMKNKNTILIIAHRLSTVINSDRILLIDDGKVVGEGTHKELLENNSLYKELYTSELKK
jgi:ABC-type multidrug transport system fused ATPase/permease subunit